MSRHSDEDQAPDGAASESSRLLGDAVSLHVYKRRWYLLLIYAFAGFNQNMLWNTWGPITQSAQLVFNWSDADIAMFANIGNIFFIFFAFPVSWMLDILGLRISIVLLAVLNFLSAGVRCFSPEQTVMYWTGNVAAALTGFAYPIYMSATALFSVTWFPAQERPVATGAAIAIQYLGLAASMITGPQMVHYVDPHNTTANMSFRPTEDSLSFEVINVTENSIIAKQRLEIMQLMYLECGIAGLGLLLTVLYFPSRPSVPPSYSAATTRLDFKLGFKKLLTSCQFWLVMLACSTAGGSVSSWAAVLAISLRSLGIDQTEAGYIGLYAVIASFALLVFVSIFISKFLSRAKLTLMLGTVVSAIGFLWLLMLMKNYIPYSLGQVYVSVIVAGAVNAALCPIFLELACEKFYPVAEGIIGGYIFLCCDICSTLILLIFYIPNIGDSWIVPTVLALTLTTIPLIMAFKPSNQRLAHDSSPE